MSGISDAGWTLFSIGLVLFLVRLGYMIFYRHYKGLNFLPFMAWWVVYFGAFITILSVFIEKTNIVCPNSCMIVVPAENVNATVAFIVITCFLFLVSLFFFCCLQYDPREMLVIFTSPLDYLFLSVGISLLATESSMHGTCPKSCPAH